MQDSFLILVSRLSVDFGSPGKIYQDFCLLLVWHALVFCSVWGYYAFFERSFLYFTLLVPWLHFSVCGVIGFAISFGCIPIVWSA
jgi:hypothetical protein